MSQTTRLVFEFPKGTDAETMQALRREIAATDGVAKSGSSTMRGLDAATLTTWVTLAGAAIPVVSQLRDLFKSKNVKGVKLRTASGGEVVIDEISADDLRKLLDA